MSNVTLSDLVQAEKAGADLTPDELKWLSEARKAGVVPEAPMTGRGAFMAGGSGLLQGVVGATLGLPEEIGRGADWFEQKTGVPLPAFSGLKHAPSTAQITDAMGTQYAPQNTGERYLQEGTKGAGSMALPISQSSGLVRALLGALSGVGGEAADHAMQGQPEESRTLGQVAPMAAAAVPGAIEHLIMGGGYGASQMLSLLLRRRFTGGKAPGDIMKAVLKGIIDPRAVLQDSASLAGQQQLE